MNIMTEELQKSINNTDDGVIAPEDLVDDAQMQKLETAYWTSDMPRCVHDMIATIRYLRAEIQGMYEDAAGEDL